MTRAGALRILELDDAAAWAQIRESYLDLVRVWHPDRFESDPRLRAKAQARLAEINEAYRVLDRRRNDAALPPPVVERRSPVVQQAASMPSRRASYAAAGAIAAAVILIVLAAVVLLRTREPATPPVQTTSEANEPALPATPAITPPPAPAPTNAVPKPRPTRSFIARETDAVLGRSAR
jgi:hypothetical protein